MTYLQDAVLVLEGVGIEPFHAEIAIDGEILLLKSKAGSCYINDLPVDAEYRLQVGDELRIGLERMQVNLEKSVRSRMIP